MKEQEDDQEDQKKKKRQQINNNHSQMIQQRMLQMLPMELQGQNSCIFLYRSSQGQLCIFKAAQSDRSNRISELSNEFKILSDLGQLTSQQNNNVNNNNNIIAQINNNNNLNNNLNQNDQNHFQQNLNQFAMQQQQQQQQQQNVNGQINPHPNIIQTFGYRTNFVNSNQNYHVMLLEYCKNGSLEDCMDTFKQVFNPFSCDQSYQNFLLSTTSAKTTQNQQQLSNFHILQQNNIIQDSSFQISPQPATADKTPGLKFNKIGSNITSLNQKIHIQIVRFIVKQVVSAISFIHSRGYYHGDIKLSNILLNKDFNIKLADFGNSSQNHTAQPPLPNNQRNIANSSQIQKVNLPHIAPEVQNEGFKKSSNENNLNKKYNGQSADIFSLGVVFFCLLFNQYPFNTAQGVYLKSKSMQNVWQNIQPKLNYLIHSHPSEDIHNLINLLSQMLSENPQLRPSIFEIEESSWMNSTETISIPKAIRILQLAQQQERLRIIGEKENKNSEQSNISQNNNGQQNTVQICSNSDEMIIEEEKINSQGQPMQASKKGKNSEEKEQQHYRLQEAKERSEKEILHTQSSLNILEKESVLSQEENSTLQNSGEAAD